MSLRKVEKVIISLVSLLVLTVVGFGVYLFILQDAPEEEPPEAIFKALKEVPETTESIAEPIPEEHHDHDHDHDHDDQHMHMPLTLPNTDTPAPVVASLDLDEVWADLGFQTFSGLVASNVELQDVDVEYISDYEEIPFEVVELPNDELYEGKTLVHQEGQNGQLQITNRVVYKNGEVIEMTEVSRLMQTETMNQIIYYGTKPTEALLLEPQATEAEVPVEEEQPEQPAEEEAPVEEEQQVEPEPEQEVMQNTAPASGVQFVAPDGTSNSVLQNLEILRSNGLLGAPNQTTMYATFEDHGSYVLVNGVSVPYLSKSSKNTTSYDGLACCIAANGACGHDPEHPVNHNTASGVEAQIGLCASNEYPFGTVLFVEEYGFCIVADRHGTSSMPDLVDVCYAPGQVWDYGLPRKVRNVYVITN